MGERMAGTTRLELATSAVTEKHQVLTITYKATGTAKYLKIRSSRNHLGLESSKESVGATRASTFQAFDRGYFCENPASDDIMIS
jgi:hypothetical protein